MLWYRFFTLLELLIVISILVVLLALLLPSLAGSRERALRISCRTTARQYAQLVHVYGSDYDGFFPSPPSTSESLHAEFRVFWQLLAPYCGVRGQAYRDANELPGENFNENAVPLRMLCPSALQTFHQNIDRIREAEIYEARPTRSGVYETAMISCDMHTLSFNMAGKQRIAKLPTPSRYFFLNDIGFNDGSDDRTTPYWKLRDFLTGVHFWGHGSFYNAAFIDGHADGYSRKTRMLSWNYVFTRVLDSEFR